MEFKRYLQPQIEKDLQKKMVFVGGARQVGKTTLARKILEDQRGYLNWDISEHREKILTQELPPVKMIVFDEIHKYRSWRNFIKGLYDRSPGEQKILVTGSARLDYYRFGGDSLQGRYHYLQLFPLSCAELKIASTSDMQELLQLGGFPEPFFASSEIESRRWSREYRKRFIEEDLQSLERVQDIGNLELLMLRLPDLVGSPLSINALREDLRVSHKTVANWLFILERLYALFRLSPFGAPKIRAVKKEQKHFHYDWTLVNDPGPRFENMVALHLLKWVCYQEETLGLDMELRYFRDVDGREVDFVVLEGRKPIFFIECKTSDGPLSKGLKYLKARFPDCKAVQIAATGKKDVITRDNIRMMPAIDFLNELV